MHLVLLVDHYLFTPFTLAVCNLVDAVNHRIAIYCSMGFTYTQCALPHFSSIFDIGCIRKSSHITSSPPHTHTSLKYVALCSMWQTHTYSVYCPVASGRRLTLVSVGTPVWSVQPHTAVCTGHCWRPELWLCCRVEHWSCPPPRGWTWRPGWWHASLGLWGNIHIQRIQQQITLLFPNFELANQPPDPHAKY